MKCLPPDAVEPKALRLITTPREAFLMILSDHQCPGRISDMALKGLTLLDHDPSDCILETR